MYVCVKDSSAVVHGFQEFLFGQPLKIKVLGHLISCPTRPVVTLFSLKVAWSGKSLIDHVCDWPLPQVMNAGVVEGVESPIPTSHLTELLRDRIQVRNTSF